MLEPNLNSMLDKTTDVLHKEYDRQRKLFDAQPVMLQRYFDTQARYLAESLLQKSSQMRFTLPDRVVVDAQYGQTDTIPSEEREQMAGGLVDRLTRTDMTVVLRARFQELEQLPQRGIAVAAGVMRFCVCRQMIGAMLPGGQSVSYFDRGGEGIPSETDLSEPGVAESDAVGLTDEMDDPAHGGHGELLVSSIPYARRFFMPQWIAFDQDQKLLVGSVAEAEAAVDSMQNFLQVLHTAVGLASYFVADQEYQRKRQGMLGQLINQGHAMGIHKTREIIQSITQRAAAKELNRGLTITLPYFDDQSLKMKEYPFEVIPAGRIKFAPTLVVRAAQDESVKIAQDTRLSTSTRNHILAEMSMLEKAFQSRDQ
jgi:hypothetical protein